MYIQKIYQDIYFFNLKFYSFLGFNEGAKHIITSVIM